MWTRINHFRQLLVSTGDVELADDHNTTVINREDFEFKGAVHEPD
jgi:hypothetical protein